MATCIICGSKEFSQIWQNVGQGAQYNISTCKKCKLTGAFKANESASLDVGYEAEPCDYLIPTDNDISKRMRITRRRHKIFIRAIRKHHPDARRILDFGAGAGYFLKYCQEQGFEAQGVELSENLITFAGEQLGVRLSPTLENVTGTFDVITMFDVIEHFDWQSSRQIVDKLVERLNAGGLFLGNTPNFESLNVRISGKLGPVISPPYHTTYFTPRTLHAYLESFGLKKIKINTMIFSEERFFRKLSLYDTGKGGRMGRITKKLTRFGFKVLFRPLFWLMPFLGTGYQIFYCYRKP